MARKNISPIESFNKFIGFENDKDVEAIYVLAICCPSANFVVQYHGENDKAWLGDHAGRCYSALFLAQDFATQVDDESFAYVSAHQITLRRFAATVTR